MIFPASSGTATTGNLRNLESSDTVLVLTAASVIEPFVSQQYQENISEVWNIDIFICTHDGASTVFLVIQLCDDYSSIL